MPRRGDRSPGVQHRLREAGAGTHAGLVAAAQTLTHAVIAFAPLGAASAETAMAVALGCSAAAGVCVAALAATRPLIGTTTASTALVTGALLAAMQPASVAAGILLAMLLALLAGLLILVLARTGLARLALHIPAPVAAGVTNAVVALILLGQAPVALGLAPGQKLAAAAVQPASIAVAAIALAVTLRRLPVVPAPLVALVLASLLHHALAWAGAMPGPTVGVAPEPAHLAAAVPAALGAWHGLPPWRDLLAHLPIAALSLVLIAVAETLTAAATLRERTGRRADPRRDAQATGAAMLAGGVLGGMPASVLTSATLSCQALGGTGRVAMLARAAVALLVLVLAGKLLALLPFAALAGVLMGTMLRLAQPGQLIPAPGPGRARRAADAAVVAIVVATALALGLVAAILAGVLLSVVIFTVAMAQSTVRRSIVNPVGRSGVRRPEPDVRLLRAAGERIVVLELQGALFFGSAEGILAQVEHRRAMGAEVVILDLGRVTRIDQSGGLRLVELCAGAPGAVLLAPVHPASRAGLELEALALAARLPPGAALPSMAAAVEAAEERLLLARRHTAAGPPRLDGPGAAAALGLPMASQAAVLARMTACCFAPGCAILRHDDPADAAYLLLEGEVEISVAAAPGRPPTRLAVLVPGVLFGEAALTGGGRRSADAWARGPVRCLRLAAADAAALRQEAPDAAWQLLEATARQLAANLAVANRTIDQLEGGGVHD
jgi:MFS superfamily sulfate permease-like transporter